MVDDYPVVAFLAKIEHGCLLLEDAGSDDDISDWDPAASSWYQDGSSIIFSVRPSIVGPVECEVWKSTPRTALPSALFETLLPCPSGRLVLHDPNNHARMQFRGFRGSVICLVMADDPQFPSKVQILLREQEG
ncbi:hypothetical protein AB0C50_26930 [Micromonospora taraxaci]|uniref:hypothetical protein n=1 Tax=Micromonospora taraxaci TaxID=1316803 RepID=UPI0033F61B9A